MRTNPRIHMLILVAVLVIALAPESRVAVGNQQGPGISDRLGNLNALCRLNGGTPGSYSEDTIKTRFSCKGGFLDGLYCDVYDDLTYCYWDGVGKGAGAAHGPREVTTPVEGLTFVTDLATDAVTPVTLEAAPEPILVAAAITWNPSAEAIDEAAMTGVNACRQLGGTEGMAARGKGAYALGCDGGLLDGLWCSLATTLTACFFEPEPAADAVATAPPTMAPAEPAMPTVAMPTEAPTTAPTMPPPTQSVAPTDEPVIEPTFADPATDDPWDLPDGPLHPLEPAPDPTEAPLT